MRLGHSCMKCLRVNMIWGAIMGVIVETLNLVNFINRGIEMRHEI